MDSPAGTQAILLAAGPGHRMPPLPAAATPKSLLPVALRPMLFYPLHALMRASFLDVTIIVDPAHLTAFETYCSITFPEDPLVTALDEAHLKVSFVPLPDQAGTADVLRDMQLTARDALLLSVDFVSNFSLRQLLAYHRSLNSTCTAVFMHRITSPPPALGKKKAAKTSKPLKPSKIPAECYTLVAPPSRLFALLTTADISSSGVSVPGALTRRHSTLNLRSDLADAHVYLINADVLKRVLYRCPAISSVKYDLIPYLARRQHRLSKVARDETWGLRDELFVHAYVLDANVYGRRANTAEAFLAANLDVASGSLGAMFATEEGVEREGGVGGKKKAKKANVKDLPFATAGDRVTLTADSRVAEGVTVGDRVSVKKTVIGHACRIGANVKTNGCVLMPGVTLAEGANLTSCIICEGAIVGVGAVLRDCRVAAEVEVEEGIEAVGRDFMPHKGDEVDDGLGDVFEFV